ncbi:hypothetical protein JTB14_013030 [Gonioctena quinquepunctata]|nr:hypothetical protein JTB14_013030 [Gonioctena quinquepunctata]
MAIEHSGVAISTDIIKTKLLEKVGSTETPIEMTVMADNVDKYHVGDANKRVICDNFVKIPDPLNETREGYRVYNPETGGMKISRDVVIMQECKDDTVKISIEEKPDSVGKNPVQNIDEINHSVHESKEGEYNFNRPIDAEYIPDIPVELSENVRRSRREAIPGLCDLHVFHKCNER